MLCTALTQLTTGDLYKLVLASISKILYSRKPENNANTMDNSTPKYTTCSSVGNFNLSSAFFKSDLKHVTAACAVVCGVDITVVGNDVVVDEPDEGDGDDDEADVDDTVPAIIIVRFVAAEAAAPVMGVVNKVVGNAVDMLVLPKFCADNGTGADVR